MTPPSTQPVIETVRGRGVQLDIRRLSFGAGDFPILKDVTFSVAPGELVGLLGPSGSGKSTLIRIVAGIEAVPEGHILVDGNDVAWGWGDLRYRLGYVPQHDIIHGMLTVGEVLHYAARLRLPGGLGDVDAMLAIHRTLKAVDMEGREDAQVRSLSGGQRKRVCLAVELLSGPSLLLLDEPTSGLDPANEARTMQLFRKIADEGRTLLVSTHQLANIEAFDRIALLAQGRLVFFGPPGALPAAFGVAKVAEVYDRLHDRPAGEWEARLRGAPKGMEAPRLKEPRRSEPPGERRGLQLPVLAARYATCTLADRKNLAILLAQAPLIAFLIAMAYAAEGWGRRNILFTSSLAAVWLGCINSCREIVKEKAIYDRERMVGLGVLSYAVSKLLVLSALCAVQTVLFLGVLLSSRRLPGSPLEYALVFFSSSVSSLCLGLLVSAVVDTSDRALFLLPIVLIPQIVFVSVSGSGSELSKQVGKFMISHWTYEGMQQVLDGKEISGSIDMLVFFAVVLFAATVGTLLVRRRG